MSIKTFHGNSQFQNPPALRWTWEFSGGQFHNKINHIVFNRREKVAKFKKRSPRTIINWDMYTSLVGLWEDTVMSNIDEEYDRSVQHLSDSAKGAESLKTTKRRLSLETHELIRQRGAARASAMPAGTSPTSRPLRRSYSNFALRRRDGTVTFFNDLN
ncbi:unnamed protein product [Heligmosomoides polygyrus]|uniref:Uncharacterized protein n=1 Tax=Heligmosomoides polygyrus TaxID=6339 RepID=A0A183FE14_HELPZ|nr:unnamed protein product [Heligmosomoides polygyrus]